MLTEDELYAKLCERIAAAGTQKEWAARAGFSEAYVSDIVLRRRPISSDVANALGFRRVSRFIPNEPLA